MSISRSSPRQREPKAPPCTARCTQGAFLRALGIETRAAALKRRATPAQAEDVERALARLTGAGPDGMGELFKAICIADPRLPPPPGFAAPEVAA